MSAYHRYGSLRPTFLTKVNDMANTVRRLTTRAMSVDLDISTFTVHAIIIKKNAYMLKYCLSLAAKQDVLLVTLISF